MNEGKIHGLEKGGRARYRYWVWVVLLATMLFTVGVRIRLLKVPLQRDEGEYAYIGQLILQGVPPYAQAYNMKIPGTYAAYALIMAAFGQTHSGIHLGLLVINTATILLMFFLGKKLFNPVIGVAAAIAFGMLSLCQLVRGATANDEHFVILPALGGILLLLRAVDRQSRLSLLGGAVLLGLCFLMKQHGAAFIVFGGFYLFFCELRRRPFAWKGLLAKSAIFLVGVLLPFAVTCLVLWRVGVFEKFWFWTFSYAMEYATTVSLSAGLKMLEVRMTMIAGEAVLLWIMAGIGLISFLWNKKIRHRSLFVVGFFLFSFLAMCPSFSFRPHYFILLLPAVALLAAICFGSVEELFVRSRLVLVKRTVPILLALIVLFHAGYQQRKFFFSMSPTSILRNMYGPSPFPESLEIARYITEHTTKDDRIAVIGSEPQIFFYSNRRSATGYIYTYALMELHPYARQMQEEMIREIEAACPKFLVSVNVYLSWFVRSGSEKMIFKWFQQYQQRYYRRVGFIDIIPGEQTIYRWDESADKYTPRSPSWVVVFQRKQDNGSNKL